MPFQLEQSQPAISAIPGVKCGQTRWQCVSPHLHRQHPQAGTCCECGPQGTHPVHCPVVAPQRGLCHAYPHKRQLPRLSRPKRRQPPYMTGSYCSNPMRMCTRVAPNDGSARSEIGGTRSGAISACPATSHRVGRAAANVRSLFCYSFGMCDRFSSTLASLTSARLGVDDNWWVKCCSTAHTCRRNESQKLDPCRATVWR